MRGDGSPRSLSGQGWCCIPGTATAEQVRAWRYGLYGIACSCGMIAPNLFWNASWQQRAGELMGGALRPGGLDDLVMEFPFFLRPRVVNDVPAFAAFLADPRVLGAIRAHLGARARVVETALLVHQPGVARGAWRAGGPFNAHRFPRLEVPYPKSARGLCLHFLLTAFTRGNGGLLVVPRSHGRSTNPGHEPRDRRLCAEKGEISLMGEAGDVLVHDARLWHAVAPNASDFTRISVLVELVGESVPPTVFPRMSPGVFRALPPSVRPLFDGWVSSKARR